MRITHSIKIGWFLLQNNVGKTTPRLFARRSANITHPKKAKRKNAKKMRPMLHPGVVPKPNLDAPKNQFLRLEKQPENDGHQQILIIFQPNNPKEELFRGSFLRTSFGFFKRLYCLQDLEKKLLAASGTLITSSPSARAARRSQATCKLFRPFGIGKNPTNIPSDFSLVLRRIYG